MSVHVRILSVTRAQRGLRHNYRARARLKTYFIVRVGKEVRSFALFPDTFLCCDVTKGVMAFSMATEESVRQAILQAADYENLPFCSSVILVLANGSWQKLETYDSFYGETLCKLTKNYLGPSFAFSAMAGLFRVRTGPGAKTPLEQVDAQFFSVKTGVERSRTYAGANATATLSGGSVSAFDFHLGAGLSTGAGIKDDSVSLKVAGCGVQVGRKVGISAFDNEFAVDFGRCVVM